MSRADEPLLAHLHELLADLGAIRMRGMFGGFGIYCDGVFFGLVISGQLFLKVDAESREAFRVAGCTPFVYEGRGKAVEMSYWSVPESAMDSPEDMRPWARLGLAAAMRKPAVAKKAAAFGRKSAEPKKPAEKPAKKARKIARKA